MTDLWSVGLFSLVVLLSALTLMAWHVRAWRGQQARRLEPRELDFRRRQYRRRMQTSGMLGVLALAVFVGRWVLMLPVPPSVSVVYWSAVVLLLLWMGLLAGVDAAATSLYFRRLRQEHFLEQARLQGELRRLQQQRGNGQSHSPGHKPRDPQN